MSKHKRCESYRKRQVMFFLYVFFLAVLTASIVIMPFAVQTREKSMALIYVAGSLFWIGVIGIAVMLIIISRARRADIVFRAKYPDLRRFGPICFFRNLPAIIADVVMILSAVAIVVVCLTVRSVNVRFAVIALFVFSFGMHCMLNGVNYIYVNYIQQGEKRS